MAKKKKGASFGMADEYEGHLGKKHKGDGAHHTPPAHLAHPHRGPHGIPMGMMGPNQDRAQNEHNEHLSLGGHSFGEDEEYGGPGSSHHLGDNVCDED